MSSSCSSAAPRPSCTGDACYSSSEGLLLCGPACEGTAVALRARLAFLLARVAQLFNGASTTNIALLQVRVLF